MLSNRISGLSCFLAISILFTSQYAFAWGQNGHRIVGQVADNHITDTTRSSLSELLEGESLAQISTWADEMRSNPSDFWQKKSTRWHYINFEPGTSIAPHSHDHSHSKDNVQNILQGMQYATATLQNRNSSIDEKRFALRFLVHLVGDSHQPFHAGRSEDRGGNNISVTYFGQNTNLHSLWDTKIIEGENLSYSEFADFINTNNTTLIAEYLESSPQSWLIESNNIAESLYKKNTTTISYNYIYNNLPIIKTRLQQAGIRLAGLLNLIFDESAKPLVSALQMQTNNKIKH